MAYLTAKVEGDKSMPLKRISQKLGMVVDPQVLHAGQPVLANPVHRGISRAYRSPIDAV